MKSRIRYRTELQVWKTIRAAIADPNAQIDYICVGLVTLHTAGDITTRMYHRCVDKIQDFGRRNHHFREGAYWRTGSPARLRWLSARIAECSSRKRLREKKK